MNTEVDWIEQRTAELIAKARRSQWSACIFDDAKRLHEAEGYAMDVALKLACDYWLPALPGGEY